MNAGEHIFPEETFRHTERSRRQDVMQAEKYSRQRRKESCLRERAYQALSGQAEIELAFHTPETVGSWSARWSGSELGQYDLEEMFWRWSERFPSLSTLDQDEHHGEPLWNVVYEAVQLTADAPVPVRQLERWMVPNKLCAGEVRP